MAASKKHDDADALIIAWERYDAISLRLAMEGKVDHAQDQQAWDYFTAGKLDKLNSLSREREDQLNKKQLDFVQPADVFKKAVAPKSLNKRTRKITATRGTMLYARNLRGEFGV